MVCYIDGRDACRALCDSKNGLTKKRSHVIFHDSSPGSIKRKFPIDIELVELDIPDNSMVAGKQVVQIGLPTTAHIVLIHRNGKYITASGETVIEGDDHLLVMADSKQTVSELYKAFGLKR